MGNRANLRKEQTSSIEVTGVENVKLTARQQLFVEAYLANGCRNSAEAMRQAGYTGTNVYVAASSMLKQPNVKKYIQLRKKHLLQQAGIQSHNILLELARIAFSDIRQLYNEDGTLKRVTELSAEAAAALEAVDVDEIIDPLTGVTTGYTKKVRMSNKLKALELLMRFKGLLDKDKGESNLNLSNFIVSLDLGGNTPKLIVNSNNNG